jgi:hypothetical protein
MNNYPDERYSWGTMDAQQLHQTKHQGSISIFGATLLATFIIVILLYGRMDTGQLILFAVVVLVVVGFIESQLTSDQFNIHGFHADGTGIDVLIRYVFENDSKATIEKLHVDWSEIHGITTDKISVVDGKPVFGPKITLAAPLKVSKPVRVVSDLSFVDYQFCTRSLCNTLVDQLLQYRDQALEQSNSEYGVVSSVMLFDPFHQNI